MKIEEEWKNKRQNVRIERKRKNGWNKNVRKRVWDFVAEWKDFFKGEGKDWETISNKR